MRVCNFKPVFAAEIAASNCWGLEEETGSRWQEEPEVRRSGWNIVFLLSV